MSSFISRKVGLKIALGYALILCMMIILGGTAINGLRQMQGVIQALTKQLSVEKELTDNIVLGVTALRFYADRYVISHQQDDLDKFNREFASLKAVLQDSRNTISDPQRVQLLEKIITYTDQYGAAYDEVSQIIITEEKIRAEYIDINAQILENKLAALRVHVNNLNDPYLFLTFGNAQSNVQSLRLNTNLYLTTKDERYPVLVENNFQQAHNALSTLEQALVDVSQRQNVQAAVLALETYQAGFKEIQAGTAQLRGIIKDQIEVLEPEITAAAAGIAVDIVESLEKENTEAGALALQIQWTLIWTAVISLVGGITLAIWLSRRITQPLGQVMHTSQQIAGQDLNAFTVQLSALAQGDVNLDLQIASTPLDIRVDDEVGQMARAFNQIILQLHEASEAFHQVSAYLTEMAGAAHSVAGGDLNIPIHPRSEKDVFGVAIRDMLTSLRNADARIRLQMERLEILHGVDTMINTNRDLGVILDFLLANAVEQLRADGAVIQLTAAHNQLGTDILWANGQAFPGLANCLPAILAEREAVWQRSTGEGQFDQCLAQAGMASCAALPLIIQDEQRGVLAVFAQLPLEFDDEWKNFLETLAGQAAIAIANAEMVHDLEERVVHRTHELNESRRFFEALVENSPVAIIVRDLQDKISSWNPAAEKMFGYQPQEARGKTLDELIVNAEMRPEAQDLTRRTHNERIHIFTQRQRQDGSLVDVEIAGMPIFVDGKHVAGLTMYHDVSDLQQARKAAEEAARAKGEFLANMSHEIRTPLNGVIGMTSLVLDTALTVEQREYVETIRKSGDALLSIINDILDFSKIEAGKLELELQPFDLRDCIESATDLVAYRASEQGLELLANIELDAPVAVLGDVTRLRQVLANLLGNAVKFTQAGEVEISVKREPGGSEEECRLHFSVRDTGVGIPPERADRLFQVFSQVDASTTRRFGGTGLGLAICKRLTDLMGGEIWAASEGVNRGTTFHLVLPFRPVEQARKLSYRNPILALRGKSLLVVDDNATNRQIINRMAQSWGMVAVECASAQEALEKVEAGVRAEAAVLDVQMPDMDGISLAGELRQRRSEHELPLILLSSLGSKLPLPPGVTVAAYLHKPVKPSQLYDALVAAFNAQVEHFVIPAAPESGFDGQMGERHPLRILLAEDHAVNQKVIRLMLERLGYRPDMVANGVEVLQSFARQDYDVVLMDIQMPEMNGLEATQHLRAELDPARQPRIIALTANALGGEREKYLAAGMNDYLSKPVNLAAMRAALERCMPLGMMMENENVPPPEATAAALPLLGPVSGAVDIAVLKEYFPYEGEDLHMVLDLAYEFLADTAQRLQQLDAYIQRGGAEAVARAAHTLKGACLTFGATPLSALCKSIEQLGYSMDLAGAAEKLAEAQVQFEHVREELPVLLQRGLP